MSTNAGTEHDSQVTQGGTQQSVGQVGQGHDDRCGSGGHDFIQRDLGRNTDRTPLREISPSSNAVPRVNETNERGLDAEHCSDSETRSTGSIVVSKKPRTRLDLTQKIEITKLIKGKTKYCEIARRYGCGTRTITRIAGSSAELEARMESPGFNGKVKSVYPALFPQVEKRVLQMIRDAKRLRVPVTGDVISSFGRTVKKQMLESPEGISEVERKRLEEFIASPRWMEKLVKRNGLVSKTLHGEDGGVDHEATHAVDVAVDRLNLEEQQGISDAVERDRQHMAPEHIYSIAGHSNGDGGESGDGEENGTDCNSPEGLHICLDRLDEFARVTDNQHVLYHVQEIREAVTCMFEAGKEAETDKETVS